MASQAEDSRHIFLAAGEGSESGCGSDRTGDDLWISSDLGLV